MSVGSQMKKILANLKIDQYYAAEKLGVSQPRLNQWLNGRREPDAENIQNFCKIFGTTPNALFEDEQSTITAVKQIFRIGFVEAGAWTEASQLPRDEWLPVNYPINDNLRKRNIFALGVRGNSMNKIFPPERTTLICLDIADYCDMVPDGIQNGDFIVAQRVSNDGKYEATVKKYNRLDDNTVVLEAMSTDPRYTNIIVGSESCEYQIIAVVIDYQTKLKDL
jgi:SOS-response transcriptional repressor LexA